MCASSMEESISIVLEPFSIKVMHIGIGNFLFLSLSPIFIQLAVVARVLFVKKNESQNVKHIMEVR